MAGMMLAVFAVAWLWNRTALEFLEYKRSFRYHRGFPGEDIDMELQLENHKMIPLGWLHTSDRWPIAVGPQDENLLVASRASEEGRLEVMMVMNAYHRLARQLPLKLRQRGIYTIGPAMAESGDPFGLYTQRRQLADKDKLVVFPEVRPVPEIHVRPRDPYGLQRSQRHLYEDNSQPMGVRDYRPEDGFRSIHWAASARTGQLQSRVYQPVSGLDLIICLNVATFEPQWIGIDPALMEALISMAASIASAAYADGYRVGLMSNSAIAKSTRSFHISPGRSPKQLSLILETLAGITPIVSAAFDRYLLLQAPRLEYGSTLMIVSAVTPQNLSESIIRLRSRGRRIVLVSLAKEDPPFIPGIEIVHMPEFVAELAA